MGVASAGEKIVCPKCGFEQYKRSAICKKCGLIFDKWREAQSKKQKAEKGERAPTEATTTRAGGQPGASAGTGGVLRLLLVLSVALAAGLWWWNRRAEAPVVRPPAVTRGTSEGASGRTVRVDNGVRIERRAVGTFTVDPGGIPAGSVAGGAGDLAVGPGARTAASPEYDTYLGEVRAALGALAELEQKLAAGTLDFNQVRQEYFGVERSVGAIRPPSRDFVSYQAVDATRAAYAEILDVWEYRQSSQDWKGKLWCAEPTCPFKTEQEMRAAVAQIMDQAFQEAARARQIAERFVTLGNPADRESDTAWKAEIEATRDALAALRARLR